MKSLVALLFVVFALVDGYPAGKQWEKRRPGYERPDKNWKFENWRAPPRAKAPWRRGPGEQIENHNADNRLPYARWCVTNPCEMKKCKRMATELNYMVSPRLDWTCVMKDTNEACMEAVRLGNADIITAEGEEVYKAGRMYDLSPFMYEKEDHSTIPDYKSKFQKYEEPDGRLKHYSIALVKKTNTDVNNFDDLSQRKSCHSGMDTQAAFKSPVCSLIQKGVIPMVGNMYECAGEFFKESCVPGVLHDKYNPNMTNPESLCKLCKGPDDDDFCETLSDKEPYYGFTGTLKCLRDGQGDVGFFHTYDVMKNYQIEALSRDFNIVCAKRTLPLEWDNVMKEECQLTEEHPQVLMGSSAKGEDWISLYASALTNASKKLSSPGQLNGFSLFDSSPYCAKSKGDSADDEEGDQGETKWDKNWKKNTDLIFKDRSSSLVTIPEKERSYKQFLGGHMLDVWTTCDELEPKPRAFFCVVGNKEMLKCKDMINKFPDVNKVSWGCVEASSKKECVEMVAKNLADIVGLNATEMFTAGVDYNLAPFMGENYKGKNPWTQSITIGLMRKDSSDLPENMRGWKMCNAGVHKISGFLHPIGWLLSNGTIERSTSLLKSIGHHFGDSCAPGIDTVDIMKHPLFSRTLDWRSLLRDKVIKWEEWYQNPLWRKWHDKKSDAGIKYKPMHDMQDFDSPEFQKMLHMMTSEDPHVHAYHTPEIHEVLEKLKEDFSWENYKGLTDFYALPTPKWKMISWVWQKPDDWTEEEWTLFDMWAEYRWDQKEDWEHYTQKWTDGDWDTFKKWIDTEYKDYVTDHKPLHQDTFIRLSVLCSRHHWLMSQWKKLQFDNVDIKHCRERMCKSCAGQKDDKCFMDTAKEDYYGYAGALKCLKEKSGDVAFIDAYTFEDSITSNGFRKDDFVLLCPDGKKVEITGRESVKECNFGLVPSNALATCNMHDGVWRWKVTKALLEAQKVIAAQKRGDQEMLESLTPIPFVNQTYQVWLGPMFLRAMEGLMQPPVKPKDIKDDYKPHMDMDDCEGEECDEEDPCACDECEDGDSMCMENCWSDEPTEKRLEKSGPSGRPSIKSMGSMMMGGAMRNMGRGGRNRMDPMRPRRKPKRRMMLWKPKARKMHRIMKRKYMGQVRPMRMQHGMRPPMRQPMMGPMMHGMESRMPYKRHHKKPMGPMHPGMEYMGHRKVMGHPDAMKDKTLMKRHKMMHHYMETGPMIRSPKYIRGEFYTNVIFARDGTCNSIVLDLSCFGDQKYFRTRAGRVGKTPITIPMCPRPTIMKKTTAQFTCNTGASFLKSILIPVRCEYAPCNPGFWLPDWSKDKYWDGDNSYPGDYWGNKGWWSFDKRGDNDNWFLANRDKNLVDKKPWKKGGLQWRGQNWRTM